KPLENALRLRPCLLIQALGYCAMGWPCWDGNCTRHADRVSVQRRSGRRPSVEHASFRYASLRVLPRGTAFLRPRARRTGASLPMPITASWSGVSGPTVYKDVARTIVHHPRAPLALVIPTRGKCAVVLGAVQGQACRWPPDGGQPFSHTQQRGGRPSR